MLRENDETRNVIRDDGTDFTTKGCLIVSLKFRHLWTVVSYTIFVLYLSMNNAYVRS